MAEKCYDVMIVGGGASGMAAAVTALEELQKSRGKAGGKVLILESNDRIGKKLLATGNGKCNFTHENIDVSCYHTDDPGLLQSILSDFPTKAALQFFEKSGMLSREKKGGFYPVTETATTVLSVLLYRLLELGCEIVCGVSIKQIEKNEHMFQVQYHESGEERLAHGNSLILATGSKAGGFLQNKNEDPLKPAKLLGLHISPLYPSLTKCICLEEQYYRQLSGVRAQVLLKLYEKADSSLQKNKHGNLKFIREEAGELQLTKEGISGIAVFQLSGEIAQKLAEKRRMFVEVNFLPEFAERSLNEWAKRRISMFPGITLEEFFAGALHKKILAVCLQAEGLKGGMELPADSAGNKALEIITAVLRRATHFMTEVTGVSDMKQAQVCRGGLYLSQFNEKLECKATPKLFACGEVLNVDGICGGYNLHFAWASGVIAGREAVKACTPLQSSPRP